MNRKAQVGLSLIRNLVVAGVAILFLVFLLFTILNLLRPADVNPQSQRNFDNLVNTIENLKDGEEELISFSLHPDNALVIQNHGCGNTGIEVKWGYNGNDFLFDSDEVYEKCQRNFCLCLYDIDFIGDGEPIECKIIDNIAGIKYQNVGFFGEELECYRVYHSTGGEIPLFKLKNNKNALEWEIIN